MANIRILETTEPVGVMSDRTAKLIVDLDDDDCTISVIDHHSSNNGTPIEIWDGRVQRWSSTVGSGMVDHGQLAELRDQIAPLIERVEAGHSVDRDRNGNRRGVLDEDATEAWDEIEEIVSKFDPMSDDAVWDAIEWVSASWQENARDLKLTANATDADKTTAARAMVSDAKRADAVLYNVTEAVDWLVERLREERDDVA